MKYISLNWTLALKFSIGKKKRMRDCRILMAQDCISIIDTEIYKICVEVFEKTISRTEMIDHSFEKKFMRRVIGYVKT